MNTRILERRKDVDMEQGLHVAIQKKANRTSIFRNLGAMLGDRIERDTGLLLIADIEDKYHGPSDTLHNPPSYSRSLKGFCFISHGDQYNSMSNSLRVVELKKVESLQLGPLKNQKCTIDKDFNASFEFILVVLPEHQSDTKVLTMKMEILLEPTSNKLLVGSVLRIRKAKNGDGVHLVPVESNSPPMATLMLPSKDIMSLKTYNHSFRNL
ncbi:hypothetical protein Tco_1356579 [Tanacetum coccineum]